MKLIGNNLSQTERLRLQLENSVHKVVTSHEGEELLAIQMTRDDLNLILEALQMLQTWYRDEKAMSIIHEAAVLLKAKYLDENEDKYDYRLDTR